ncbi:MAG: site-specific integrase [Candidatus Uhrbacteria bacterium]
MPNTNKLITEFLEHLEVEKGRSLKTIRNYNFYLQRFYEWAGQPTPKQITKELVRKYRLWLNRSIPGRAGDSLKKKHAELSLNCFAGFPKIFIKTRHCKLGSGKN